MNSPNEDQKPIDNMELLKQQASDCVSGCACHADGPWGRKGLILGTIVLLVAVTLVARAVIKTNGAPSQPDAATFTSPIVAQTPLVESAPAPLPAEPAQASDTFVAKEIGALAELNTAAAASDAVFVYVPGKNGSSSNPPATAMQSAANRIGSQGYKIGLFTLKAGTRDYDLLAAQMSVPGVLAAFKGRGMSAASGDITETKLIQAFVAASSAGGCGPGGCGPAGCAPAGSK
jgi:hypothetical protein